MSAPTFTARDLNRQPAKVLNAARKFGPVEIQTRSGETFIVSLKKKVKPKAAAGFPDYEERGRRLRALGHVPPPPSENERINRIIAGED